MTNEISLKEYVDTRIKSVEDKLEAQSQFMSQHFALNELAISKAENAMLVRLENMNEFRSQLSSERSGYATKESVALIMEAFDSRLKKLENSNSFSAGRLWMIMAVFAIVPTIIALIAFIRSI